MTHPAYRLTRTARAHLEKILRDTARKWGYEQAASYRRALSEGFRHIAENHQNFNSPHREELAEGRDFSVHLVEHHYVSFRVHDAGSVIIAAIFHERMNIPARLRELQSMRRHAGKTLSAHISQALERDLRRQRMAEVIAEFEAEHGVIGPEEVAKAIASWQG